MDYALTAWVLTAALAAATATAPNESSSDAVPAEPEPEFATPTTFDRVGRIVAPVMINELGPFRLVVDTGANGTTLSTTLANKLGLDYVDGPTVLLNGVTGSALVPIVKIEKLELGALVLENQSVAIVTPDVLANTDGILGVAGLKDKQLVVDFKRDKVSIKRSKPTPSRYMRIRAQHVAGGLLLARARIGRVRAVAVIDTGAESTLGNRALQEALKESHSTHTTVTVLGATSHVAMGDVTAVEDIVFGNTNIRNARITFGDFHVFEYWDLKDQPAMILGMDILGTADIIVIDFRLKLVSIGNEA